jgi:two-component system, chemotaxis family, sensor kinase CheA
MDQNYSHTLGEQTNEDQDDVQNYYNEELSWSNSEDEIVSGGQRFSSLKVVGIVFTTGICALLLVSLFKLNLNTEAIELIDKGLATTIKAMIGLAILAIIMQGIYLSFVATNSLQQAESTLKTKNDSLESSYAQLLETKEELGDSNESLQEALNVVQEISKQNEARAKELEVMANTLDQSKRESDAIFDSVQHGLWLIDSKFNIGTRVSQTSYTIFETEVLAERNFVDLMRPLVTEKDLRTLVDYLKLQFEGKIAKKQLARHNPLKKIEITLNWDGNSFKRKHLGFEFERVKIGKKVGALLVTITDISEMVSLENQLKKNSEAQDRKAKLFVELLQNDSQKVDIFVAKATKTLDQINETLKDKGIDGSSSRSNSKTLEEVFNMVHNIKGNAGLLKLKIIAGIAHDIESKLAELRGRNEIKGEEFLGALVGLAELREILADCEDISLGVLKNLNNSSAKSSAIDTSPTASKLKADLSDFAASIANELGKKVILSAHLEVEEMGPDGLSLVKDVIIQGVRNALVHGIEGPEERQRRGKIEEGLISIICKKRHGKHSVLGLPSYDLIIKDDGRGLDLKAIKEKGIEKGLIEPGRINTISNSEIAALIFEPSLSTADGSTHHAGRGSGMGIIKDHIVNSLDGKISMRFSNGIYMELLCNIPANSVEPETLVKQ